MTFENEPNLLLFKQQVRSCMYIFYTENIPNRKMISVVLFKKLFR